MQSVFQPGMDMEHYLEQRALDIQDLKDRKLFKDIVGELLLELYRYTQSEYQALEQRVFGELQSTQSEYAIYIGLIDRARYDATDPFLQPIRPEDAQERTYSIEDLLACGKEGRPYPLYSIFLEANYEAVRAFAREGRIYRGMVRTTHGSVPAKCAVRPDRTYLEKIEALYHIFSTNYLPWSTVCTAYLHKFFQVELLDTETLDPTDSIQEIRVDFEEYQPAVRYNCIPLWNLAPVSEKTSAYPEPCMDKIHFEHRIFAHRLDPKSQYLVADSDVELINIQRLNGDLVLTCPEENPRQWLLYRVNRPHTQSRPYPVLSNLSQESFAGSLSERYRRGIKTKAEIARILSAYGYENYVRFQDAVLVPSGTANSQTYCMDEFLLDELRTQRSGNDLLLTFASPCPEHFLTLDIMSFLVTQIQSLFPEYACCGRLA